MVQFVLLFWFLKVDLESRTFVFLHANGGTALFSIEMEYTIQPIGGDDEGATEATVFIRLEIGRADFLPIGVAERDTLVVTVNKAQILTLMACRDTLEIDGLSRTVDGTVGKELGAVGLIVVSVTLVKSEVFVRQQVVITLAQVDVERIAACLGYCGFAVAIGFRCGNNDGLVFAGLVVPLAAIYLHRDTFHAFPRFAVNSQHGHLIILRIRDESKAGNLESEYQGLILTLDVFCGGGGSRSQRPN